MSNRKDQNRQQASSEAAKYYLAGIINNPDISIDELKVVKEKHILKSKSMDNKKVFQELEFINSEGGPQQLANLIAEACFSTMLHRLKEDRNEQDYEFVEDCYANWQCLTRNAKKQAE